jgi:DNA (cytosine-5)-methyltransferase 1
MKNSYTKVAERFPTVLDLFAGCGGLSLGFHAAGFRIAGAIELDPDAAASHALNFHRDAPSHIRSGTACSRDVTKINPEELLAEFGINGIDIIVGGPPCQAFARVGRAKLREVAAHPTAFKVDPRGNLYLTYLRFVEVLRPAALLIENVPDVINYGGHNIPEEICEVLDDLGYSARYTLLNSVFYGVPQMRERMFLLAFRKDLKVDITFPQPTHWIDLPRGYEGSRQVALKNINWSLFRQDHGYIDSPVATSELLPAVTARQAIEDLPPITAHLEGKMGRGVRRFTEHVTYREDIKPSSYARLLRDWPGYESDGGVYDHVIRWLPRDWDLFRRMRPGIQ